MGLSIRVKSVQPQDDMQLLVTFENGIIKRYDVKQLLPQFPHYSKLKDKVFFNQVTVDCGGCAVAWDSDIDISEVELWEGGITELSFNSKLSLETIEKNFQDVNLYDELSKSLNDALAHTNGLNPEGVVVHKVSQN